MSDVISKICSMPRDFHFLKNKSMIQLFNDSGYLKEVALVTKETLMAQLMANPDLIADWKNYSSDKRVSQGWYFLQEKSAWVVGYASTTNQEQKFTFASGYEAYAEFILRELRELSEYTTRI